MKHFYISCPYPNTPINLFPISTDRADVIDLDKDGEVSDEERRLFAHFNFTSDESYDPMLEGSTQDIHGFYRIFSLGGEACRERMMATWQNTSLLTALFLTITVPAAFEPPPIEGIWLFLFYLFDLTALIFQTTLHIFGLGMTIQLIVRLDRVPGNVGTIAYLQYPGMMNVISTAYSLSYGLQFWFTLLAVIIAVAGQVPWEDASRIEFYLWIAPMVVLLCAIFVFVRSVRITQQANIHAADMQRKAHNAWQHKRQPPE